MSMLLVAAVCAALLAWPVGPFRPLSDDRVAAEAAGAPVTPVLSLRRAPAFLAWVAAGHRLRDDIDRVLADARLDATGGRACVVVHDAEGRAIYTRQPDLALAPASTIKLLTAATALHRIGPDSRLTTEVRTVRPPVDGLVDGDLWLVGGGDPLLATADFAARAGLSGSPRPASRLEDLADRIVAAGVRQVRGRLLGDATGTTRCATCRRGSPPTSSRVSPAPLRRAHRERRVHASASDTGAGERPRRRRGCGVGPAPR